MSFFFINIPIGLAVLAGGGLLAKGERHTGRLDTPGALAGTGAMVALTYGITHAAEHGWGDAVTLGALRAALVLALLFLWLQARGANTMLPLGLLGDRNRSGSYATMLFVGAGLIGTFYLLALYLQQVLAFNPLWTGMAALPFSAGIILGAGINSKLVERFAPRLVAGPGLLPGALGMLLLSALAVDSFHAVHVMRALFLTSFGLGMAAVTMTLTAVHGVAEGRAGVASALVNMAQQIGAALGLAVFTTVAVSAANRQMPGVPGALPRAGSGWPCPAGRRPARPRPGAPQGRLTRFLVRTNKTALRSHKGRSAFWSAAVQDDPDPAERAPDGRGRCQRLPRRLPWPIAIGILLLASLLAWWFFLLAARMLDAPR